MLKQPPLIADALSFAEMEEERKLLSDERWLLVQRVLQSAGFQRAGQLRKILLYITRSAILHPEVPLREYEIACEVLGRRPDFDPISDNIVRAQMSHLRRKLEAYYLEEGRSDTLHLSIPKGSYFPVFDHVGRPSHPEVAPVSGRSEAKSATEPEPAEGRPLPKWGRLRVMLTATCLVLALATGALAWKLAQNSVSGLPISPAGNAFVSFLSKFSGGVTVVLPDSSLSLLQHHFQTDISVEDYASNRYLQKELGAVSDPQYRELLYQIGKKRYTSMDEANVASEMQRVLTLRGVPTTLRFARDLHGRDLNQGNTILVGSRKSNPWTSLFNQRMNFLFLRDTLTQADFFENLHPQAGELPRYVPYQHEDGKVSSYIDVALTTNLTSSGYVLLFNGSDSQAVEAASHFLLYGKLPPVIDSMLRRDDLNYFEIFLRGTHADFESDETFQVIGVRSGSGK